jgi:hypothetical protein
VCHRHLEAGLVSGQQGVEEALEDLEQAAVRIGFRVLEVTAAEHRCEGQRHEAGDQNRDADGDREFVQQAPDNAAHEQHRDEHGNQREGHRNDREADLPSALDRCVEGRFALFDVADDILQHHDRIVDDEADTQRQRQQRKIVQAVTPAATSRQKCRRPKSAGPAPG